MLNVSHGNDGYGKRRADSELPRTQKRIRPAPVAPPRNASQYEQPRPKNAGGKRQKKLFIGNIDQKVSEAHLGEYCSRFGKIAHFTVMPSDKHHQHMNHRGFGFLRFCSVEDSKRFEETEHRFEGKLLNVSEAVPETKQFFVGGIARDQTTEASMKRWFSQYGEIADFFLNIPRGFAFITMYDDGDNLRDLVNGNYQYIDGKRCEVRLARTQKEQKQHMTNPRSRGKGRNYKPGVDRESDYPDTNNGPGWGDDRDRGDSWGGSGSSYGTGSGYSSYQDQYDKGGSSDYGSGGTGGKYENQYGSNQNRRQDSYDHPQVAKKKWGAHFSRFHGVFWSSKNKWVSQVFDGDQFHFAGYFSDERMAGAAVNAKCNELGVPKMNPDVGHKATNPKTESEQLEEMKKENAEFKLKMKSFQHTESELRERIRVLESSDSLQQIKDEDMVYLTSA